MAVISLTRLYDFLSLKFGKESAENLTMFIESKINDELKHKSQLFATKDDVARLELKINDAKIDLIRWMVTLWLTLILMVIGLFFKS